MAGMGSYLKDSKYNIHKGPSDILGPLEKRESKMIPKLVYICIQEKGNIF